MIHIIELHKASFALDVAFECDTANTQNLRVSTDTSHFPDVGDSVVGAEAVPMDGNMAVGGTVDGPCST